MKLYLVTIYDYGTHGPRGLMVAGSGRSNWADTDRAKALRHYQDELQVARAANRKISIKLQLVQTPERMTAERWIKAIVDGWTPFEVLRTLRQDYTQAGDPALQVAAS